MISRIIFILCLAGLWRLGGWDKAGWAGYRDVLIPIALGLWYAVYLHVWWMVLAVGIPTLIIRLGYGSYDPEHDDKPSFLAKITHDRSGNWIRMIYGVITAALIGLAPAIYTGSWLGYGAYVILNGLLEFALNKYKVNVWGVELGNGAGRALVVALCK
jgi:hypothetical protein